MFLVQYFKNLTRDYPHVAGFLYLFAAAFLVFAGITVFGLEAIGSMFIMLVVVVVIVVISFCIGELIRPENNK